MRDKPGTPLVMAPRAPPQQRAGLPHESSWTALCKPVAPDNSACHFVRRSLGSMLVLGLAHVQGSRDMAGNKPTDDDVQRARASMDRMKMLAEQKLHEVVAALT